MKTKEILAKIPIEIDDFSKLHVFFLALNQVILNNGKSLKIYNKINNIQNDPYYAMSFISLTNLDRSSQTIYKNLKVYHFF